MPNRNGIEHEEILDLLRFGLANTLAQDPDTNFYVCIADEGMMASLLNEGNGKGERPDIIICRNETPMLIEVGSFYKGKWDNYDGAIIQVSHKRAVGLIRGQIDQNIKFVLEQCRKILGVY